MERTIKANELKAQLGKVKVIDVRRKADLDADTSKLPNASWHDPEQIDNWIGQMPKDQDVVLYCVRGGSVSNGVVDKLQAAGVKARFIEGGIVAWKEAGGEVIAK